MYVALHKEYGIPIASSKKFDTLREIVDEWIGENKSVWTPYDCKYPDDYQGSFTYVTEDSTGEKEEHTIKVYAVDFK